ncbi:hypothetical protein [Lysinibacillus fusiformis]|uniref:hypothetical protein n=1 Tax=Lysinibacillus fusiformis TaxID=28031 RepID=UPI0018801CE2|nr:hypothetical protein [Lysinibacillus fusiformis]MBD8523821.1 hypothetical protein [Lysinibacillus fusiformis]
MNTFLNEILKELTKVETQDYEGYWTYAHSKELNWENGPFKTKEEAVAAGQKDFPCGFAIGQLKRDEKMVYNVINIEKITFS